MRTLKTFQVLILLLLLLAPLPTPTSDASAQWIPPLPGQPGPLAVTGEPDPPQDPLAGPTIEEQLVELVNQARWDNGQLPPLKHEPLLDQSAETHTTNMAGRDFFAHCDLDTHTNPSDRMRAAGYDPNNWGENIAAGYGSPQAVMSGWMGSSGHRANILSTGYRELGVGYVYQSGDQGNVRFDAGGCQPDAGNHGPYYHYWTQNFGRRNDVYPLIIEREAYQTTSTTVSLYLYGPGPGAEMRFCNAGGRWSDWMPYNPDSTWTLSAGVGLKTVLAEIRSGSTIYSASDSITLAQALRSLRLTLSDLLYLPFIAHNAAGNPPCTP